ncbi:hypothetical protein D3C75_1128880 [compost metagenome]
MSIARSLHRGHQQEIHFELILFTRQRELVLVEQGVEQRIFLNLKAIDGIVRQIKLQRFADALSQHTHSLVWQTEHQIHRQIMQTDTARVLQAAVDIIHVMDASDAAQQLILECLHAEADPVDAAFSHNCELILICSAGIGLH